MNTSKKAFFGMLAATILLIVGAIGITQAGLGTLQKKGEELSELKAKQEALQIRQTDLISAKQAVEKYTELEKISKAIVPQEKDQARTVREIIAIGQQAGTPLESVEFPSSDLGAAKSKSKSKSKSKKSTVNPDTTQLVEVPGSGGLYAMEISIKSSSDPVPYTRLLNFLERLEQNRRTAHVTNISITPSSTNRNLVTFSVTVSVYIKP
jgi:type II secretory pathway component PulM